MGGLMSVFLFGVQERCNQGCHKSDAALLFSDRLLGTYVVYLLPEQLMKM